MTLLYIIIATLYVFFMFMVFGSAIVVEPKMPLWFIILGSLFWPITVAIGLGVSAGKG